jgi:hypothetical protein
MKSGVLNDLGTAAAPFGVSAEFECASILNNRRRYQILPSLQGLIALTPAAPPVTRLHLRRSRKPSIVRRDSNEIVSNAPPPPLELGGLAALACVTATDAVAAALMPCATQVNA